MFFFLMFAVDVLFRGVSTNPGEVVLHTSMFMLGITAATFFFVIGREEEESWYRVVTYSIAGVLFFAGGFFVIAATIALIALVVAVSILFVFPIWVGYKIARKTM